METLETQKNPKKPLEYICKKCDFISCNLKDYTRHVRTQKHRLSHNGNTFGVNGNKMETLETPKNPTRDFKCKCGKTYTTRAGLWKHQKTPKNPKKPQRSMEEKNIVTNNNEMPFINVTEDEDNNRLPELYLKKELEYKDKIIEMQNEMLTKQEDMINKQEHMMKNMKDVVVPAMEVAKASQITNNNNNITQSNNHINNTHTNSHNKTFNLQFFLNDTCKDAMNITEFVNSLKLTLQDLEHVGEAGYAEGISRVLIKGLNDLDVNKRPIHCSDIKREVIHIKDQDKWERDTSNQDKLKKAIKDVSTRNIMLLDDWRKENPGCTHYNNNRNDMYLKMQIESLGPADSVAEKKDFGKIIKSIAKTTIIDKNILLNIHNDNE